MVKNQLDRLHIGVIKVPDRDYSGMKACNKWEFKRSATIYPPIDYKDIDEALTNEENIEIFMQCYSRCLEELENKKDFIEKGSIKIEYVMS